MKVAVYGSLRKGLGNHRLLENSEYLGDDQTPPEYTMISLSGFPGVLMEGNTSIKIEVYETSEDTFQNLDYLEGYPSFYNRIEIQTKYGKAWMYYLQSDEYFKFPEVQSGDWVQYKQSQVQYWEQMGEIY